MRCEQPIHSRPCGPWGRVLRLRDCYLYIFRPLECLGPAPQPPTGRFYTSRNPIPMLWGYSREGVKASLLEIHRYTGTLHLRDTVCVPFWFVVCLSGFLEVECVTYIFMSQGFDAPSHGYWLRSDGTPAYHNSTGSHSTYTTL